MAMYGAAAAADVQHVGTLASGGTSCKLGHVEAAKRSSPPCCLDTSYSPQ